MSDLPDVKKTVKRLKTLLCEPASPGPRLERKHLNALVCAMRYPSFDEVRVQGKAHPMGLRGLGDWLAGQEGYERALCQWVEAVWSRSLGLQTSDEADAQADERAKGPPKASSKKPHKKPGKASSKELRKTARQGALAPVFRDRLSGDGKGPAMVVLPRGEFRMGNLFGNGHGDEWPVHTVTISRRIAMGQYPVTFEDYDRFVAATDAERPDDEGWGRGRKPVIDVNWYDARAYAVWLSEQTGKRYRLPSESEWEYAARAGTETAYSWGNEIGVNRANCDGSGSEWSGQTSPVGSFAPNGFGLYDMHGNVWEWVEDGWHDNYEGAPSDGSASTSGGDSFLAVVRGGSWGSHPRNLRSAYRDRNVLSHRGFNNGFRLVQDLNP